MSETEEMEREKRQFWAVTEDSVVKVTGFSCEKNPDLWWCPEVGFSGLVGYSLFEDEEAALDSAILTCEKRLNDLTDKLRYLERRRSEKKAKITGQWLYETLRPHQSWELRADKPFWEEEARKLRKRLGERHHD